MSNERGHLQVPADTTRKQYLVADPDASAWVSANAGSGKTFVLTRRVLRLLLAGATPESILCLTYTKAAAAEMRHRVSQTLAKWARDSDVALEKDLTATTNRAPTHAEMGRARSLFAHALETPGGLKINTIHAFCEAVLHRFPLEAGVPINFTVVEDITNAEMITRAREAALARGLKGDAEIKGLADAVNALFSRLSDSQIEKAISEALMNGRKLEPILKDTKAAMAALYVFLNIEENETADALHSQVISRTHFPVSRYKEVFEYCPPKPEGKTSFHDKLFKVDVKNPEPELIIKAFLSADGEVPKRFPVKAISDKNGELANDLIAEAERLASLNQRMKAARIAENTQAILTVLSAIMQIYETEKRSKSLLDFDDLVVRTAALFSNPDHGAWVRYKLDSGIDHILVDESQDTNPDQWRVIEALADEFFTGDSSANRTKTIFAVGDPKQSIYSFQGAEPRLFGQMQDKFRSAAKIAGAQFHAVELQTSFRTLGGVLAGVDAVAARQDVAEALFAPTSGILHESARANAGGVVEMWNTVPDIKGQIDTGAWPLTPVENLASAPKVVARGIVKTIARWVNEGIVLGQRGRAIRPDDILILVQKRNNVFREIVKALKDAHISSPGADRLPVSTHIAIDDLLGLADVLLNPLDDLLLAAILRSPLCGLSEDELYVLAHGRGEKRLWERLAQSKASKAGAAYELLHKLRGRLDFDRPYEFFANVLYAEGGLQKFHARLGAEVDEVIAEFLDLALAHEQSDQPSLTGFVAAMRASDIVIKRDLVDKAAGVRIMTVHGAKGLEAPIVFLADAAAGDSALKDVVFFGDDATKPFMLYCAGKANHTERSTALKQTLQERAAQEYWRLLYVAMTRAEDALIVTGATDAKDTTDGTWYAAIEQALGAQMAEGLRAENNFSTRTYPKGAVFEGDAIGAEENILEHKPALVLGIPQRRKPLEIVMPSRLDEEAPMEDVFDMAMDRVFDAETARQRGIALHALLQHLGNVPEDMRDELAIIAAETLLPDSIEHAEPVAEAALGILNDPALAHIFADNSRPEVSFAVDGFYKERDVRFAGRIDRLVVSEDEVLIIDFKSDAYPPKTADKIPPAYVSQLGLYAKVAQRLFPQKTVKAAILWSGNRVLMQIDNDVLRDAAQNFVIGEKVA